MEEDGVAITALGSFLKWQFAKLQVIVWTY
jgi:hypothetical protein